MGTARRGRQGYTLIEAVVAIAVVCVGLLGVFQVLASTMSTNVDARNRSFATHFAERRLEALRSVDAATIQASTATSDPDLVSALGADATWSLAVTPVNAALKGVTLNVTWKQAGQAQSVSLSTLAHNGGIAAIRHRYAN